MSEKFGSIQADADLDKIIMCREIVKKIVEFGVTQEQILMIVQLLGYELENHDHMLEVVGVAKELLGNNSGNFFVNKVEA